MTCNKCNGVGTIGDDPCPECIELGLCPNCGALLFDDYQWQLACEHALGDEDPLELFTCSNCGWEYNSGYYQQS